jgi:hypothetical protein
LVSAVVIEEFEGNRSVEGLDDCGEISGMPAMYW